MKNIRDTNLLLKEIETESSYYIMKLNNAKCEVIAMNKSKIVKLKDGTKLKHVKEATYLGGKLIEDTNANTEIQGRISACIPRMKTLDTFWKKTNCDTKWNMNVFNAVVLTKLIYGRTGNFTGNRKPISQTRRFSNERAQKKTWTPAQY